MKSSEKSGLFYIVLVNKYLHCDKQIPINYGKPNAKSITRTRYGK